MKKNLILICFLNLFINYAYGGFNLDQLPEDSKAEVFKHLDVNSLKSVSLVSKKYNKIARRKDVVLAAVGSIPKYKISESKRKVFLDGLSRAGQVLSSSVPYFGTMISPTLLLNYALKNGYIPESVCLAGLPLGLGLVAISKEKREAISGKINKVLQEGIDQREKSRKIEWSKSSSDSAK